MKHKVPAYPGEKAVWSAKAIEFLIIPFWLIELADRLDDMKVDIDTDSIREAAHEINRLRHKYEPQWAWGDDETELGQR